jgi:DnaJ-class molecular chaperone
VSAFGPVVCPFAGSGLARWMCARPMGTGITAGAAPPVPRPQCPTCKGTGRVVKAGGSGFSYVVCGDCEGTGRL